jgi:tripartite-type tricarboxylate transporter receptor subunit TctC
MRRAVPTIPETRGHGALYRGAGGVRVTRARLCPPYKAFIALVLATASCFAQDWPARQVSIIVPFAAGSTPDMVARLLANQLAQKHGGTNFMIDNKPGASGNLGTNLVAKAAPDGHTIGVSIGGPLAINKLLFGSLPYDPRKDIAPITQLVTQPSILAVNSRLEIGSVAELLSLLQREPSTLNYGSIGTGSLSHLAMEAIAMKVAAHPVHVPFAGSGQAMTALIRGDVQMACLPAIAVTPHGQSGEIRMLAVSTSHRSRYLPDLPTLKEGGLDIEADAWNGLIAPGGTPEDIISRIHADVLEALSAPSTRAKLAAQLMEPVGSSPSEFRIHIAAEIDRWAPVIKAAGIRLN